MERKKTGRGGASSGSKSTLLLHRTIVPIVSVEDVFVRSHNGVFPQRAPDFHVFVRLVEISVVGPQASVHFYFLGVVEKERYARDAISRRLLLPNPRTPHPVI